MWIRTIEVTFKNSTGADPSSGFWLWRLAGRLQAEQLRHAEIMDDYLDPRQVWTTRDVAVRVHSGFRSGHTVKRFPRVQWVQSSLRYIRSTGDETF